MDYARVIERSGEDKDFDLQTAILENNKYFAAFSSQDDFIAIDSDYNAVIEAILTKIKHQK